MTSPEWEAANEDDSDRFPQTSHASASESTESHELGSRVVPDPARVARWEFLVQNTASYWPRQKATAAMRLADEERAALVAEVERLRHASKQNAVQASRADRRADRLEARAAAAEAEVERLWERLTSERSDVEGLLRVAAEHAAEVVSGELGPRYLDERLRADREEARAEAAEAKVAKVEEQHVRVGLPEHHRTEKALAVAPDRCSTCWIDGNYAIWPCPTIAVLADAPAEQRAEGGSALGQLQAEAYQAGECGHLIEEDVQVATASAQPPRPSKWVADLCGLPRGHAGEHVGRMSLAAEGDGRG